MIHSLAINIKECNGSAFISPKFGESYVHSLVVILTLMIKLVPVTWDVLYLVHCFFYYSPFLNQTPTKTSKRKSCGNLSRCTNEHQLGDYHYICNQATY